MLIHPPHLGRRLLLSAAASLPFWGTSSAHAQSGSIRLGQTTSLSGPLSDIGVALQRGAMACFGAVNEFGGIHGQRIELISKVDAYDAQRGLANIESFLADPQLFGLFNCLGTPVTELALRKLAGTDVLYFAPLTGAQLARPRWRNVFNIRASYAEEVASLIKHLATVGIKRVGFIWQNNRFGQEAFAAAKEVSKQYRFVQTADVSIDSSGDRAPELAAQLMASEPEAIVMLLAGKPSETFVKAVRRLGRVSLYALSVMGASNTLRAMGPDSLGITVSQVVPLPTNITVRLVREFREAWKAAGHTAEPSHMALEGYLNARVFVEILYRTGRNATRASFIDTMWKLNRLDLGHFEVTAGAPGSNASHFVELTMVGQGGRFMR